jgi:hypothetical protein
MSGLGGFSSKRQFDTVVSKLLYNNLSSAKDMKQPQKRCSNFFTRRTSLNIVNTLLDDQKVTPESQIYLGIALAQIVTSRSRALYHNLISNIIMHKTN